MLIGHQKQWQFLKKAAKIGRIPHSLLFFGENNLGKKIIALEFIKYLNCENSDFSKKPCQLCRSCQSFQKGLHPDFYLIEPHFPKEEIQIAQIREVRQKLSLRSYSASFKAVIIDQAHCMTKEAQSSFLKTLEEPKGRTILILITQYPELLLATILSRVQKLKFSPVKKKEIENYLIEQGCSKEGTKLIASFALGRPGIALNFFSNPEKLEVEKQKIAELLKITTSNSDLASRFQFVKNLASLENKDLKEILDIWLRYYRNALCQKVRGQKDLDFPFFDKFSLTKLKSALSSIQRTSFLISETNVNPKLALEILMLQL